jgi:uncharacterized protein (DUF2345 family)
LAQLQSGHELLTTLSETAQAHKAMLPVLGGSEAKPKDLAVIAQLAHSAKVLQAKSSGSASGASSGSASESGANSGGNTGGTGSTTAYSEPMLVMSAPAGMALLTPQSASLNAGATSSLSAGQDINLLAQGHAGHSVKGGISLFTYGKASNPQKPNVETGIKLHAASGKVSSQSQSSKMQVTADKAITVASTTDAVSIQAKEHVLLTAQGAYIKLSGGNIEVHAPGMVKLLGSMKSFTSGMSDSNSLSLPVPGELNLQPVDVPHSLRFAALGADDLLADSGWAGQPFAIVDDEGTTLEQGTVAADGRLPRITSPTAKELTLRLGDAQGAQLIARPQATAPNSDTASADEGADDTDITREDIPDIEAEQAMSKVIASRYYQEVLGATTHHSSEFLSVSQIRELLDKSKS